MRTEISDPVQPQVRVAAFNPEDGVVFPWPFVWGYAGQAVARGVTRVAELPAALFLRGAGRSGGAPLAERELSA